MQRRPLCVVAILLVLVLWMLPEGVWQKQPDIPSGEMVSVTGTVYKREQKEGKQVYYLKNCLCSSTESEFSLLAYVPIDQSYPIGCKLSLYGTIYHLNKADNPGQFDAERYYQSQGILYIFQAQTVIGAEGSHFLKEPLAVLREILGRCLSGLFSERDAGILRAVILGDKSALREEDELLYQKNGISHLLAISGLHISMIGTTLYALLRKWGLTFWEAGLPSGLVMVGYGMMTGFGISTIRAVCMFLVMIGGEITGKAYDMASAMALASILILCENPLQARQAGFLLSFGAVLGICLVYPVLESAFGVKKKWFKGVLFTLSLTLVTGPLSIHFFYEYPLYSMILNFIVIPFMPIVMGSGAVSMFAGLWVPKMGKILGLPAHAVLSGYEVLGEKTLQLPGAVLTLGAEESWQLVLYYALLFGGLVLLWYGRRRIYAMLLPMAVIVVLLRFRSPLEFTMLDVGQGDGLLLRISKETTCLIDGGSTSVKNVGTYRILPYLKYEGIAELDYIIVTHLDEDHINGIRELVQMHGTMEGVEIRCMMFPYIANPDEKYIEMWKLAEQKGIKVEKIGSGDRMCGENWEMVCLSPKKESECGDKNESSTILSLEFGAFSMLLTGDLGESGEELLCEEGVLKDIDVWKVSHHGSKYSGSSRFLETILPNVALISVGRNNYGHPSRELLGRLKAVGSRVWNTLDVGAIRLESDGESYGITLQRPSD